MRYTEGVCGDGAAILCDGVPVTVEDIVRILNDYASMKSRFTGGRIKLFAAPQVALLPPLPENLIEGLEDYEQTINVGDVSGCGDVILDTTTMTAAKLLRQIYSIK